MPLSDYKLDTVEVFPDRVDTYVSDAKEALKKQITSVTDASVYTVKKHLDCVQLKAAKLPKIPQPEVFSSTVQVLLKHSSTVSILHLRAVWNEANHQTGESLTKRAVQNSSTPAPLNYCNCNT